MVYHVLADVIVVIHLGFVLFAALGGFLVLRWAQCAWIHIPAVIWAASIEFAGWVCPLTPLENWLRVKAGTDSYTSGFIEHYIVPVLYPATLTRELQITLGVLVMVMNLAIYGWIIHRLFKHKA
ncbi:MAG: DUF2784 domain-containing protein [Gammaproteobacteria bacterium]|nr:DUF2784 domain-containing protein [Gammaproteobacteria bacterium]MCI0590153.1 DUF2784 domain-containing protein [Gammaproteobacteria bacterium]